MTTPLPSWVKRGATVAIFYPHATKPGAYPGKVVGVGSNYISVDSRGFVDKFHRDSLAEAGWSSRCELRPMDDPEVAACFARENRKDARRNATQTLDAWVESGDPAQLAEAIAALTAHVAPEEG